jgi:hypothetical protein
LVFALLTASAAPAWGATVDIRCSRLSDASRGELEARARLFLTSADMESASIGVECDATNAWLIWTDGSKTTIDARTNIVEGTLDAIEDRIARAKRGSPPGSSSAGGSSSAAEQPPGGAGATGTSTVGSSETPPDDASFRTSETPAPTERSSSMDLEGGVGLALLTEFWSGDYSPGVGPRLDVGVGLGRKLSFVISEGARFAAGSGSGNMMTFDLQAGIAYGAPYQTRTGFGVMMLFGAERLASSRDIGGYQGLWTWAATASLGARASLATGPLDAWIGVDGMLRSDTIETGQPRPASVPTLSAILSIGCFLPAFAGGKEEPRPQTASR